MLADLVSAATDKDADPAQAAAALTSLLERTEDLGTAAVFDILAREPRIKPTRSLVIDPGDSARRRWSVRVAAAAALLASPAALAVFDELVDELAECPDLAVDVLTAAVPHPDLGPARAATLENLLDRAR